MAKTPIEAIRDFSRLRDSKKKSHRDFIPKNMKKQRTYIMNIYHKNINRNGTFNLLFVVSVHLG